MYFLFKRLILFLIVKFKHKKLVIMLKELQIKLLKIWEDLLNLLTN
jgi:hypothetical protein